MAKRDPKKMIVDVLKKHPEGLTLQKIANLTSMSRLTATKYVHELLGQGIIYQRKVGIAKLCYLKEKYTRMIKEDEVIEALKKKFK